MICAKGTAAPYIKFYYGHCRFISWVLLLFILYAVDMLYAMY